MPAITALARAGAVERAWALFESSGHGQRSGDAALAVKGRLLKDRARRAEGARRAALFAEAAAAYGAAHDLEPAPYLALNLATTRLLAGDGPGAEAAARSVLALLDAPDPPADTPYYLAATRAEALLLLGDLPGAQAAMAEAARRDPDGWDDRAGTLAQLAEIHAALGLDALWLRAFRPPATLHFAGHLALESGGAGEAMLAAETDRLLAAHGIGLGCGTIAAGCDIVIAERVLARGGDLHLFLPSPPDAFEAQSVAPAGAGWVSRYRALLGRASSLHVAGGSDATHLHDPLATQLAGEMAIGTALIRAGQRATQAFQIVALDAAGGGPSSKALADFWPDSATALRLTVPRETDVRARFSGDLDDPARRLASVIAISLPEAPLDAGGWEGHARAVGQALKRIPATQIGASEVGWEVLLNDPAMAARAALAVLAACQSAGLPPPAIGLAHGIVSVAADLLSHRAVPLGPVPARARRLARQALAGTAMVCEPLALALAARQAEGLRCEWFHDGEGEAGDAVYALIG